MTGTIRINGQSLSVPTYIVEACKDPDIDFQTKVFLDQVLAASKRPAFEDFTDDQKVEAVKDYIEQEVYNVKVNRR